MDEMKDILHTIQGYLPYDTSDDGEKSFDKQLLVGDQLTVDRAVNAIHAVSNGYTDESRLEGLIPAIADWHTGMKILEVIKRAVMIVYRHVGNHKIWNN